MEMDPFIQADDTHVDSEVSSGKAEASSCLSATDVPKLDSVVQTEMDPFIQADDDHEDSEVSKGKAEPSSCLSATNDSKLDSDMDSDPANKKVLHEKESQKSIVSDFVENQKCDIPPIINVSDGMEKGDASKVVDRHEETVYEPVSEEKDKEGFSASHFDDIVQNPEGDKENNHHSGTSPEIMLPETKAEGPESIESFLSSNDLEPQTEILVSNIETSWAVSSTPTDRPKSQIIENGPSRNESLESCTAIDASSASDSSAGAVLHAEMDPFIQTDDDHMDSEVSRGKADASICPSSANVAKLDSDPELDPASNKLLHEKESKESVVSEFVENHDIPPIINVSDGMEKVDEIETASKVVDQHEETVYVPFSEEKDKEGFSVSHFDDNVQNPGGDEENNHYSGTSPEIMLLETEAEAPESIESFPSSNDLEPLTEILVSNTETYSAVSSTPVDGPKSQIIGNGPSGNESLVSCTAIDASSASDSSAGAVVHTEMDPFIQTDDTQLDCEVSSGKAEASSCLSVNDVRKLEPEYHDFSGGEEIGIDVTSTCKTEVCDGLHAEEGTSNIVLETEGVIDMGGQFCGSPRISDENLFMQGNEDTGDFASGTKSLASPDGSSNELIAGEHANGEALTKPFNFVIRIPRFIDDNLNEWIRLAKLQLDEKTKLRDAVQLQIQERRASSQIHVDFEYAKKEDRSARKLVRSKRKDIDNLQNLISKAQSAISIEDIDNRINNMEHRIQHETLPLKGEKLLIREIKHYRRIRAELSSNMGSQDEVKQAVEQKPELEERLKILRKELDALKGKVVKAEAAAVEAEKKYDDENKVIKELQAQYKAAHDVREAAYAQLQSLNKELTEKDLHFFKLRRAEMDARKCAYSRDKGAIYDLRRNQVEKFMEIWNTNEEFRRDYVSSNARSAVRRLGTFDGRSLGPDEEPPFLPSYVSNRMVSTTAMVESTLQNPALELKQEAAVENVNSDDKLTKKMTEHKNQKVKNREVHEDEEPLKSWEEIELARKEEERRREEIEAELREQRRLEGLAKAKEARERKKRQAEKIQMRAQLKAQKEAEQKEKEREKRLRKKERKKAGPMDVNDSNNCEAAGSSEESAEIGKEMEVKDISSSATTKRPHKPTVFVKQSKTKSIPPPLRNRNKKKWQQYAWVCVTSFLVLVLFGLGNIGMFPNISLKRRSPV